MQERLNVAQHIDSAKEARRGSEAHGIRLETEQLPIFGITKDALLALRYRHEPDGKVGGASKHLEQWYKLTRRSKSESSSASRT